jgi:hypothetical protein
MFDFVTTTGATVVPFVLPLLFVLQPGASTAGSTRDLVEHFPHERSNVQLFEPTQTSIADFRAGATPRYATSQSSAWAQSALEKIEAYADIGDGWRGEGSRAPSAETLKESAELLLQIASEMPNLFDPLISVDEDGFACLHWNGPHVLTTISIYGDGTYSFFSEGYGLIASSDSHDIGAILPEELIATMTGQISFESTIAA